MRVGWWQHVERGLGMSEGLGHIQRMGYILGGHGVTHCMSPSVVQFAWMWGWQRRCVVGVRMRVHKHRGHGQHDVVAAMMQGKDVHVCVIVGGQQKLSMA